MNDNFWLWSMPISWVGRGGLCLFKFSAHLHCCLECSIYGCRMPALPWLVFFDMCTGVRLWMCKYMPCKWECTMPAWHVHGDRDRDMRWLRAALSHRYLWLYSNALTTLPPDVFDSLGSLLYVIPVPKECVVAANVGHEWQFLVVEHACLVHVFDVEGMSLMCMRAHC